MDGNRAVGSNHVKDNAITFPRHIAELAANKFPIVAGDGLSWLSGGFGAGFTNTAGAITPDLAVVKSVASSPVKFASAEQAIAAGITSVAHGLAGLPQIVRWVLVCKTIDVGYAVGDEVDIFQSAKQAAHDQNNFMGGADVTNVFLLATVTTFTLLNKGTGAYGDATAANWKAKAYAIYFP